MCFLFALVVYRMYSLYALPSETEHPRRAAFARARVPTSEIHRLCQAKMNSRALAVDGDTLCAIFSMLRILFWSVAHPFVQ